MNEQIRHAEYRVGFILADNDINDRAVFFRHYTVNGERHGNPLIFFNAAVIMRIHICKAAVFIQRVLLDIKARTVDMRSQNVHAVFQRLAADIKQHYGFFHADSIYFIAGMKKFLVV